MDFWTLWSVLLSGMRLQALLDARLSAYGLSHGQYSILLAALEESPAYPSRVAERLGRSLPTVVRMIDKLVAGGLLNRAGGGGDGRRKGVELSGEARRILAELAPGYRSAMEEICGGLSTNEKADLSRLLAKLRLGRDRSPFNDGPSYKLKCGLLESLCRSGTAVDVDSAMSFLDERVDVPTTKIVDYYLGSVSKPEGVERLRHYLMNGSPIQRNYCALFFERRNDWNPVNEAYRAGLIDYEQAYSR